MRSPPHPVEVLAWTEQDGVDLSLLRERLQLTPTERWQFHQLALALVETLRQAKRKSNRAPGRELADRSEGG